ncbi:MAG: hypothetical protein J7K26_01960 [Candidatus Aenigmarchaeota archaeon]|nr:hypothetical protein [Candidatus Aenigmarchaeota archaeon]
MKAVSEIVSHALYFGLTILVITFLVIYINNTKIDMRDKIIDSNLNYVAETIKSNILDLYSLSKQTEIQGTIASIEIQDKKNYEVILENNKIIVKTNGKSIEKSIDIPLEMHGKSFLPAKLELIREGNKEIIEIKEIS